MKVMIVGGGIGGLTAALSLHEAGIEVEVFEAVREMRPLGVGINCLPHAVRELTELGMADRLERTGVRTRELVYVNKYGQRIWREERGQWAGYAWPQYSIHRGRLQMLLWEAALERLGPERIRIDHALASFEQDERGVRARFVSRSLRPSGGSLGQDSPTEGADRGEYGNIKSNIRNSLKSFLKNRTKRTPMIVPIVIEI